MSTVPNAQAAPLLFNAEEAAFRDLTPFKKWRGMLERHTRHRASLERACPKNAPGCYSDAWNAVIRESKSLSLPDKLARVNRFHNSAPYILDPINWGVPDYWATPTEFSVRDGDCEDYAIAKYITLLKAGVSADSMRIVVLHDENLKVIHSVLAVFTDSRIYILDNQIEQVVTDSSIHHYTPIYSINERGWWRHRPKAS